MAKAKGVVPNLVNGISQQNPATRLPSQGEVADNFYPTILKGSDKRPATDHLANLGIDLPTGTFTHFILRDAAEKYVLAIGPDGAIRIWDMEGTEQTVDNTGASYLTDLADPTTELRALTIADHTFIVNKSRYVQAGSVKTAVRPYEALIGVLAGNYGKRYRALINGTITAEFQTPNGDNATHAPIVDTVNIANELYNDFVANSYNTGSWAVGRYHSTVYIRNTSFDFALATEDGYSGRAMKDVKKRVQKFTDLPTYGPAGVVIEVQGDENTGFDNYWVEFVKEDNANSSGVWKECVAPDTRLGVNAATMPHILVRQSNGTWSFGPATWDNRKCGDEDKCPDPSFVGQQIEDVFFHRNRLGFLTKENIVMSEAGRFYNFYRTTLTALLDTDPIDIAASHVKVSLLRHAVPYSDVLLIFSDQTQFRLQGNELLTPKTVNARPLSEHSAHPVIRPAAIGTSVYFLAERDGWASLQEYFIDKAVENADTDNVSSHAPAYIPAGIHCLAASPDLDLVFTATTGDPGAIYGYKFYWQGQEKVQSAWFRWVFPEGEVLNMTFDKGALLVLMRRGATVCIERINCELGTTDPYGASFKTYLDRHAILEGGTYDAETNTTTFDLPYAINANYVIVTAPGELPANIRLLPLAWSTTVTVPGDLSVQSLRVGIPFASVYEFSQFFLRNEEGRTIDQDGRLQILHMAIAYNDCASFRVEVKLEGRPTRTYPFTGRIVSEPLNVLDDTPLDSGRFSFPVMSRSDRVKVRVINDSWLPSSFVNAKWTGTWNDASRQQ